MRESAIYENSVFNSLKFIKIFQIAIYFFQKYAILNK